MAGSDGGGPTIIGLTVQVEEDPGAALAALAAVSGKAAAGEDYAPPPDGGVHGSAATGVAMAVRDAEEAYEERQQQVREGQAGFLREQAKAAEEEARATALKRSQEEARQAREAKAKASQRRTPTAPS